MQRPSHHADVRLRWKRDRLRTGIRVPLRALDCWPATRRFSAQSVAWRRRPRDHQPGKGVRGVSGPEKSACLRRALPHHVRHVDPGAAALRACAPSSGGLHRGRRNVNRIYLGALLELLLIIANIGTAVVIVPIMRRQFEELSIGYVTARIVECTFILVGIVAMLGIATLQQETAGASEGTVAYTLAAIKDWTFLLGPGWIVGWGNGLILGYMMYRTGLVPRRATWLGLVGGPLIIISGTVVMFGGDHGPARSRASQRSPRACGNSSSASTARSGVSGAMPRSFPGAPVDMPPS